MPAIPSPLQDASASVRGAVNTVAQTFPGAKTFSGGILTNAITGVSGALAIDAAAGQAIALNGSMLVAAGGNSFSMNGGNFSISISYGMRADGGGRRVDLANVINNADIGIVATGSASGAQAVRLGTVSAAPAADYKVVFIHKNGATSGPASGSEVNLFSVMGNGTLKREYIDDSANTGNRTVNAATGKSAFAAAATTITITNDRCVTGSVVKAWLQTNDATALIKNIVPGAGSFVVNLNAAATGTTTFYWEVENP